VRPVDTTLYDLIAIGSGPAGRHAALQAAKLGKRAAVVEREDVLGGVSTNTGTLSSKTLRAAIVELTGQAQRVYGSTRRLKNLTTIDDLLWRTEQVIEHERDLIRDQLRRSAIDVLTGTAAFVDPHTLEVCATRESRTVRAENFVIAVGARPARPPGVEFDGETVLDSDGLLRLSEIPQTLTVVGGGVIGLEYASMAAALGVHVTVVERCARVLDFVDEEIAEALSYHLGGLGVVFRLGEEVDGVRRSREGGVVLRLRGGKQLASETVLYAAGRHGATEGLNLAATGLEADDCGRIAVGSDYRTEVAHIFAAGDVVGFPGLASTSIEQGRLAALAALGEPVQSLPWLLPYGIYTIPEISFIGPNEQELAQAAVPHVVGVARYRELVRGEIAGDRSGLLKLLVHAQTRQLLGVHIFGTGATELIHLGQAVIAGELMVEYLVDAVFNVPTFTDAYKVAALDACNRLDAFGGRRAASAA
jgi:NAD(P) transhydrogenase